jgi:serine/threonine-protein kinase
MLACLVLGDPTTNPLRSGAVARARPSAPPPAPGELLDGRLRVTRWLGAGAESDVFAAWDRRRAQTVAVKVARGDDLDDAVARLGVEVRALREVRHANLVRLFDARVSGQRCYLVLEALQPASLAARVEATALAVDEAVRVIEEVAAALTALHRGAWAHCDVKPENVLFGLDERAVLTDLGLAQRASSRDRGARGTPAYMAPETVPGGPEVDLDWRAADQYALALTGFYALTGSMPFLRDTVMATLCAQLAAPVPSLSARRPELARFDPVFARALAKDPRDRYPSVAAFSAALSRALRDRDPR